MSPYRLEKATAPRLPPLDATERAIAAAILAAVAEIRDQTVLANIRRALELNDIAGALEAIRFDMGEEYLRSIIPQQLRMAYEQTGIAVARAPAIGYSFNILTPQAVDWVRENAGSMIRQWGDSSRDALRRIMADGFQNQVTAAVMARRIKDSGIGLTWRQARAVLNMRHRMEADGIAAATIDARAERYFKRLLRYRAELIARTEMARASANARREAWRQAIGAGLLDTGRNEQEWLARIDARTCFPAGTFVLMRDGSQQRIETVRQGDFVQTHLGPRAVVQTYARSYSDGLVWITTATGSITATRDHLFVVLRGSRLFWCRADTIQETDLLCEAKRSTYTSDRSFHVSLSDANNAPAMTFHPGAFPDVPSLVAVPVISVRLQDQPRLDNQEINGVAADSGFRNKANVEASQLARHRQLQPTGADMLSVARLGAEALDLGHRRNDSECDTAVSAFDANRWTTAGLRTVRVSAPLGHEECVAAKAVLVDGLLSGALDRTIREAMGIGGAHVELLSAGETNLGDACRVAVSDLAGTGTKRGDARFPENDSTLLASEIRVAPSSSVVTDTRAVLDAPFAEWLTAEDATRGHHLIVYDIETGVHTFFANRVLVHNCSDCTDLDGARASVPDGHFTGDGGTDGGTGPPQHPQCRCVSMIVPAGSKKLPRARVNIPGDPGIRPRRT
jgi:hypothetical protein